MGEAGETGGILDLILQRLSTFIEKLVKLKRDVVSALIYPTAVVLLAVVAVAVIMIVVIPQFQNIFLGLLGPVEALPLPTRIVVGFSNFLAGWGGLAILAAIIGTVVGVRFYYKTPKADPRLDSQEDCCRAILKNALDAAFIRRADPASARHHGAHFRQPRHTGSYPERSHRSGTRRKLC